MLLELKLQKFRGGGANLFVEEKTNLNDRNAQYISLITDYVGLRIRSYLS